ncbi:MAG: PKD domain-containing protein [Bacteroidota bacterium]
MKNALKILLPVVLAFGSWMTELQAQCVASFTYTVNNGTVSFTNTSPNNLFITTWTFGDGNSSFMSNPTHTYNSSGSYVVCLTVSDSICNASICDTISVVVNGGGSGCQAAFNTSVNGGQVTMTNTSTGNATYAEWWVNGVITDSLWNSSYTFNNSGTQSICLYVYDSNNVFCDSICQSVVINLGGGGNCQANFTASVSGSTVNFSNTSTGNFSNSSWTFGDGNTSGLFSPSHTYNLNGTFVACLTVSDSLGGGCTSTYCDSVVVNAGGGGGGVCQAGFNLSANGGTVTMTNTSSGGATYAEWWVNGVLTDSLWNSSYTFNNSGTQTICLYVYDSNYAFCDSLCQTITVNVGGGGNCLADFTYSVSGSTVSFTNTSTGNFTNSYWTFGDGSSSGQFSPTHTYNMGGYMLVCLTVSDTGLNCLNTWCDTILVNAVNPPVCQANFTTSVSGGQVTMTNTSTGSATYAEWWVNGVLTDSLWNSSYTFNTSGPQTICLYVYDSLYAFCDSICQTVNINLGGGGCQADFSFIDSAGVVFFSNSSIGAGLSYFWDFGDSTTSTAQHPAHTFAGPGTYLVCLTISGNGCNDSYCDTVVISGGNNGNNGNPIAIVGNGLIPPANGVVANGGLQGAKPAAPGNTQPGVGNRPTSSGAFNSLGAFDVTLFPNPATEQASLRVQSEGNLAVRVVVANNLGQVMNVQRVNLSAGANRIELDVQQLANGLYHVQLVSDQGEALRSLKLIKH